MISMISSHLCISPTSSSKNALSLTVLGPGSKMYRLPHSFTLQSCRQPQRPNVAPCAMLKIACVGDVHDCWDSTDNLLLAQLKPDVSLFVGDFGNENVPLVELISRAPEPIATMLGNHDSFYSGNPAGLKRRAMAGLDTATSTSFASSRVNQQLSLLGRSHVGYSVLRLPELGVQVVGGRPFSRGGGKVRSWQDEGRTAEATLGIRSYEQSAKTISNKALVGGRGLWTILLSHSGPTGLGAEKHSPCGKDWEDAAGDFGDPDLELALERIAATQHSTRTALCVFGHMHHRLYGGRHYRNMIARDSRGVVHVNCAVVSRWKTPRALAQDVEAQWCSRGITPIAGPTEAVEGWWWRGAGPESPDAPVVMDRLNADVLDGSRRLRNFTLITMDSSSGKVETVREAWVEMVTVEGEDMMNVAFLADWLACDRHWKAFSGEWAQLD